MAPKHRYLESGDTLALTTESKNAVPLSPSIVHEPARPNFLLDDVTSKCRPEPTDRLVIYWIQDMEMQLNEREASLVDAFRRLPSDAASELSALAERLAELAPSHRIDWSDSWSDEDMNDFRAASLRRFDAEESEDRD